MSKRESLRKMHGFAMARLSRRQSCQYQVLIARVHGYQKSASAAGSETRRFRTNYVKNTNNGLTSELCQKYSQHRQKETKFADAECLSTAQYDHATKKTTPTMRSRQSAK